MDNRLTHSIPLIVTFLGSLILSGCVCICGKPSPPSEACPVENILIEKSDLPITRTQWPDGFIGEPPSRVLADKAEIMFSTRTKGGLIHAVYSFWYLEDAKEYYKHDVTGWFTKTKYESEWISPNDLQGIPVKADNHDLRCNHSLESENEKCKYFARYKNYVVELSADIIAIDHEQLSQIIMKIDQNMNICFGEK